jgi:thymidylate synthase (FAD)
MSEQSVKFVTMTPNAEESMAYIARVSNPSNQNNTNYARLLQYCIKHNHWSVFEQSYMTLEINTTRGIAAQICRYQFANGKDFSTRTSPPRY